MKIIKIGKLSSGGKQIYLYDMSGGRSLRKGKNIVQLKDTIKEEVDNLKILARHLTIDMYKCKASCFGSAQELMSKVNELLQETKLEILNTMNQEMPDGHIAVMVVFPEGHMTFHAFPELRYVSADTFLCQQTAAPELLFNSFRRYFKPEKTKTTLLRRGDFGEVKDMKPKYQTRMAPVRKIRNAGSKVIRTLTRKSN